MSKLIVASYDGDKIYNLIKDNIYSCETEKVNVETDFHHNAEYEKVPFIIKHGILSFYERLKLENRKMTDKERERYYDEYCVCGTDYISIASNIDAKKIPYGEICYGINNYRVDILLSDDLDASKRDTNYCDEYTVCKRIDPSAFKCFDIRILDFINFISHTKEGLTDRRIKEAIEKYNSIIDIARAMIDNNLDIPIREMSLDNVTLDKKRLVYLPKIKM